MKTIKTVLLIFCVSFLTIGHAQTKDKNILKVTYTGSCISDFLVSTLKKQIQDPDQLSQIIRKMEDYKIHSTYYQNLKTKESIFVLDSITEVKNMSTSGHTYFVVKNKDGQINGKEVFMGKDIDFKGTTDNINWTITNEQKEIKGYRCKKAHLKDNPSVYVWFAPEMAINGGPYTFFGLQGLVLESNSIFESINVSSISYSSNEEFQKKSAEVKGKIKVDKAIQLEEVFAKKENFQRTIEKG